MTTDLIRLFAGPTLRDRASWALPVTAQAVVSALGLSVAGGVGFFFSTTGELAGFYRICAAVALVLLLFPLGTLAGAAARLSATQRDLRLSSLRLLGASKRTLRLLTLAESGATALAGALLGVVGYVALLPVFGLLQFTGRPLGAAALWLGPLPVLGGVLIITLIALVSSALGLRRIEVTPLGVRTRAAAPLPGLWRLILGIVALAAAVALSKLAGAQANMLVAGAMGVAMLAAPLVAVNALGPWVLGVVARRDLRTARTAVDLLAARSTLENPKQLWRQIGALGLTSFAAVFCAIGLALTSSSPRESASDRMLTADLTTGVLLTLGLSFVTVACSLGINQTAAVLDRRGLYVGLDLLGMPAATIDRARRRAVVRPLGVVVGVGVAAALVLVLPLGLLSANTLSPSGIGGLVGTLAGGLVLVLIALRITSGTLRSVLATGLVRTE